LFLDAHYTSSKPWTRKEIADWAGTTSETVIRTLSLFEDQKLITTQGKRITILNPKMLSEKSLHPKSRL
jgi:CRP-like cAMP-binding protein